MLMKLTLLMMVAAGCLGASAMADEYVLQTIYPPQGQAIQLYQRVAARESVALYHRGRGAGTRCAAQQSCDSSVETARSGNGQPVSYSRY